MIEHLNGWFEGVLALVAALGMVVAAYRGAARQTGKSLAPLVGDPPEHVEVPFSRRLEELLRRLERQEERQLQSAREVAELREDVTRNTREVEAAREQGRGHEERVSRLERRVDNVERRCNMHTRQADASPTGGPA